MNMTDQTSLVPIDPIAQADHVIQNLGWFRIHPRFYIMPHSSTQRSQRVRALRLLKQQGMARLTEFRNAGITAATISRLEEAGEITRLTRGLYQLPDAKVDANHTLAQAAKLVPRGVVCLTSALAFHELIDKIPPKVWLAIGSKDWRPALKYPPVRFARFPAELLNSGVETRDIEGIPVRVFSVAKTSLMYSATGTLLGVAWQSRDYALLYASARRRPHRLRATPTSRAYGK